MSFAEWLEAYALPQAFQLEAYQSARSTFTGPAQFLDANEYPLALDEDPYALNRYPQPQPQRLVQQMAQNYEVRPDSVLVTRGADEAIELLIRAFCEPHRTSVLTLAPTYGMYKVSAATQGTALSTVDYRREGEGLTLDPEEILEALGPEHRLMFWCRPNNPSAHVDPVTWLETLAPALRDNGTLLVIDEAYAEFMSEPSLVSAISRYDNVAVLRTLSKAWGLAGLRCGALVAPPELIALCDKLQAPYPIPAPSAELALGQLQTINLKARVEQTRQWRAALIEALNTSPMIRHVYPSQTNFVFVEATDANALYARTREAGIILRNQSHILDNHLRISVPDPALLDQLTPLLR